MRIIATALLTVALLIALALAVIYSGSYNVAASKPHSELGRWVFRTAMEQSVRAHARDLHAPASTSEAVGEGAGHYAAMCEGCHGAPGVKPSAMAKGLRPAPPELSEAAAEWNAEELFWIVKHGIKMTGMPAWGEVDDDEELWQVVAFVQALPELTPDRYQEMKARYASAEGEQGERAGDAGHSHSAPGHAH